MSTSKKRTVFGARRISINLSEIQQNMQPADFQLSLIWQGSVGDFRFEPIKKADSFWCAPMSGKFPDFLQSLLPCQEF
jgi:hypothetical protein